MSDANPGAEPGCRPIDSHCHLQMLEPDELAAALEAARERGVRGFLVPATRLDEAAAILELCERHDDVWCALGVHPHEASSWGRGDAARLAELAANPAVVAIGECGLDFHYDHSPRRQQERAMREQWEVAVELGLPAVIHNRDSDREMMEIVRRAEFDALVCDFHSFAAGSTMAAELVERGHYLGISGMVTFRRAENVREVLPIAGPERLLVETDTPYLAPVPYRGKPNRPAYVVEIAERVAAELGLGAAELADATSETFFRLFPRAAGSATT